MNNKYSHYLTVRFTAGTLPKRILLRESYGDCPPFIPAFSDKAFFASRRRAKRSLLLYQIISDSKAFLLFFFHDSAQKCHQALCSCKKKQRTWIFRVLCRGTIVSNYEANQSILFI